VLKLESKVAQSLLGGTPGVCTRVRAALSD
jgi:hypothetical protein